jgi:hypothetical protein
VNKERKMNKRNRRERNLRVLAFFSATATSPANTEEGALDVETGVDMRKFLEKECCAKMKSGSRRLEVTTRRNKFGFWFANSFKRCCCCRFAALKFFVLLSFQFSQPYKFNHEMSTSLATA